MKVPIFGLLLVQVVITSCRGEARKNVSTVLRFLRADGAALEALESYFDQTESEIQMLKKRLSSVESRREKEATQARQRDEETFEQKAMKFLEEEHRKLEKLVEDVGANGNNIKNQGSRIGSLESKTDTLQSKSDALQSKTDALQSKAATRCLTGTVEGTGTKKISFSGFDTTPVVTASVTSFSWDLHPPISISGIAGVSLSVDEITKSSAQIHGSKGVFEGYKLQNLRVSWIACA